MKVVDIFPVKIENEDFEKLMPEHKKALYNKTDIHWKIYISIFYKLENDIEFKKIPVYVILFENDKNEIIIESLFYDENDITEEEVKEIIDAFYDDLKKFFETETSKQELNIKTDREEIK